MTRHALSSHVARAGLTLVSLTFGAVLGCSSGGGGSTPGTAGTTGAGSAGTTGSAAGTTGSAAGTTGSAAGTTGSAAGTTGSAAGTTGSAAGTTGSTAGTSGGGAGTSGNVDGGATGVCMAEGTGTACTLAPGLSSGMSACTVESATACSSCGIENRGVRGCPCAGGMMTCGSCAKPTNPNCPITTAAVSCMTVGAATNTENEIRNMTCTTLGQTCVLAPPDGGGNARGCVCWNRDGTGPKWACGSVNSWFALTTQ